MDILSTLAVISGIVFLGFFAEILFKKTNIPDVLILILVGILIGTLFGWVNDSTFGTGAELFSTFALIFILFQGSLSIEFKPLLKSLKGALSLTVVSFLATLLIVTIISLTLGYSFLISLLIGSILAGTSSSVVIPLVNNIGLREKYGLVLTLESAISDVLCIIGTITILEILKTGNVFFTKIFQSILSSFSLALIVGIVVGVLWMLLLDKLEIFKKSYMLSIATVIALYAFVESPFVGASGAIAVLAFGLVIGNSKTILQLKHENKSQISVKKTLGKSHLVVKGVISQNAKSFYDEISFFVKTFFFVYLGLLIDFSNVKMFFFGFLITMGIFLIRPFVIKFVFRKEKLKQIERVLMEILITKGLAAAVLAGISVQSGLLGDAAGGFVSLILSVVFLSILITSILVFFSTKGSFKGFLFFLDENVKLKSKNKV